MKKFLPITLLLLCFTASAQTRRTPETVEVHVYLDGSREYTLDSNSERHYVTFQNECPKGYAAKTDSETWLGKGPFRISCHAAKPKPETVEVMAIVPEVNICLGSGECSPPAFSPCPSGYHIPTWEREQLHPGRGSVVCYKIKPDDLPVSQSCHDNTARWFNNSNTNVETLNKCVKGKWVIDQEGMQKFEDQAAAEQAAYKAKQEHQQKLWDALRTRVVTDPEMVEIMEIGAEIIPEKDGGGSINWCGVESTCTLPSNYAEQERMRAMRVLILFQNALLAQFKMRTAAGGAQ
jgi:hypothetical protein